MRELLRTFIRNVHITVIKNFIHMKYIDAKCPNCGKITRIDMTDEQYKMYVNGESYIQNIFPNFSPAVREMLITGICPTCWNEIFKNDE